MSQEPSREPTRVRSMFDGIAGRYDLLNHLLSGNLDRRWRRAAVAELPEDPNALVLDLCGGTGDLSVALARGKRAGRVICCDFSHEMLLRAQPKFERSKDPATCITVEADGLRLPFPDATFDGITVGFGVRNLADMDQGFREMLRVLKPGCQLVVLEFSKPTAPITSRLYNFYLKRMLPRIGDGVSGKEGPYVYLARTIAGFPDAATLAGRIREAGFAACGWKLLTGGIVAAHTAVKA